MRVRLSSDPRGFLFAYAVLSLMSVGAGCWVAAGNSVPVGAWARDLAAWVLGLVVATMIARGAGRQAATVVLLAALVGLAATFLGAGLSGVHRWVQLGPVRANVAEMLLPGAVVALAGLGQARRWPWLVAAAVGAMLIAQPDASQATAFGGGVIAMLLVSPSGPAFRWTGVAMAAAVMGAAWLRPDPLAPVPEVEGIFQLAWALSPVAAILAAIVLGATVLAPALVARSGGSAAVALTAYFAISALAPALGAFPTPLVGVGVSPILGWWLGAGLIAALATGRWTSSPLP